MTTAFKTALLLYILVGPTVGGFTPGACPALSSPLFRKQPPSLHRGFWKQPWNRKRPTMARHMVLRTPESIIEEASTQNLLDDLIDESVRTSSRRPIMMQFDPSSGWIWRRWTGTVFSETWTSCVRNMVLAIIVAFVCHSSPGIKKEHFNKFDTLWGQLLSVTTFTLTFFLNQSYALWRKCYGFSRRLQGRLNDLGMTLAAHASRKMPANPNEASTYTTASRQLLELISRYIRVFNLLTYASFTRSHRPMLTPRGMRRLVERGILTPQERQVLVDAQVPATQRHNAVLIWITRLFEEGRQQGHFMGGAGFEEQFLEKFHVIRAQYGAIGDELQGRMPLAYAHIVQVLVDVVLWLYPFMAYSIGMSPLLGALGTGVLTFSYQGLFDLAKQFLDPYDNESFGKGEDPLCVDTLIAETNAGSVRWLNGFEEQPFSSQRIKDGELFDYQLPLHGYSVEELKQMEAEQLKKEQEALEKREAERREREEAEREEMERLEQEEAERLEREESQVDEQDQEPEQIVAEEEAESQELVQVDSAMGVTSGDEILEAVDGSATSSSETEAVASVNGDHTTLVEEVEPDEAALDEDEATVHTVTSIEGGLPVTLDEPEPEFVEVDEEEVVDVNGDVPETVLGQEEATAELHHSQGALVNGDAEPNGESDNLASHSPLFAKAEPAVKGANGDTQHEADNDGDDLDDSLLDFDIDELEWYNEIGPDGQEYRLSQMLADEVWDEEIEYAKEKDQEKSPMTYEEYTQKAAEIMERVENELIETEEILNAAPGAEASLKPPGEGTPSASPDGTVIPPKRVVDRSLDNEEGETPYYDQTKLDPISQLWGLSPHDPGALDMPTQKPGKMLNEDVAFDGISQLWGEAIEPGPKSPSASRKDDISSEDNFSNIAQLWGRELSDLDDEDYVASSDEGYEDHDDDVNAIVGDRDSPIYGGLEWHDEVGPDGKEYRLSQMLADEVWEEEVEPQVEAPITLEDYIEEITEKQEAAEEELKETEAILNMPPGAADLEIPAEEEEPASPPPASSSLSDSDPPSTQ